MNTHHHTMPGAWDVAANCKPPCSFIKTSIFPSTHILVAKIIVFDSGFRPFGFS
jgi:hypothetical protein